jgi:hypothetical protein
MLITPALSISFIKILLIYNTVVDAIMQGVPPCRLAVLVGLYSTKKFCEMEPNFMSGDGQSYVHAGRRISKSVSQTMLMLHFENIIAPYDKVESRESLVVVELPSHGFPSSDDASPVSI